MDRSWNIVIIVSVVCLTFAYCVEQYCKAPTTALRAEVRQLREDVDALLVKERKPLAAH